VCPNSQICAGKELGFLFPVNNSCTKFRQCTQSGEQTYECPTGTYFNRVTKMCDCGANSQCGGVSYEKCPLTVETNICEGRKLGEMVSHPHSCEGFYQCSAYGPALFGCPQGTAFDINTRTCHEAKNVKCSRSHKKQCCGSNGGGWGAGSGCCGGVTGGWSGGSFGSVLLSCRPCGMTLCCLPCISCCVPCGGSF
jgi:Chitin binding Peritrophin-A domain